MTPGATDGTNTFRNLFVGVDEMVPVAGGVLRSYINFDNAASTPALKSVLDSVNDFSRWYSNVHRGTGYKSRVSSWAFEKARTYIHEFVNADPRTEVVLFSRNTTESINHLAQRFPMKKEDVILTSVMEHHSNELPWRKVGHVVHVNVRPNGQIDDDDFRLKLKLYKGKIALAAITGASNVTGYINPIHDYARWVHEAGGKIFIDAAQLAPHRPIDMKQATDPGHIDFLAFSAHKMYAPFGIGALVGDRKMFEEGDPTLVGGGSVDIVTLENAYWTDLPDKEEAGTPDIIGTVALGTVIKFIRETGWKAIIDHETELTQYALKKLGAIPGVTLYGDTDPANAANRLGVIPLNVDSVPHALAAAILSYEWGIGSRSGCFCAHPYVKAILNVNETDSHRLEEQILHRDRSEIPGTVRVSFGLYNTISEIDYLTEALTAIAHGKYLSGYILDRERGEYTRSDVPDQYEQCFKF